MVMSKDLKLARVHLRNTIILLEMSGVARLPFTSLVVTFFGLAEPTTATLIATWQQLPTISINVHRQSHGDQAWQAFWSLTWVADWRMTLPPVYTDLHRLPLRGWSLSAAPCNTLARLHGQWHLTRSGGGL